MVSYLINEETCALIPVGNAKTNIIENTCNKVFTENCTDIVSYSCKVNGSTLDGRQKGSSYLIGSSYKPPIIINDEIGLILIPTHSTRNKDCIWISLNNLLNYGPIKNDKVEIEFRNHEKMIVNTSFNIFDKQVLRATRLESALRGRNSKKNYKYL